MHAAGPCEREERGGDSARSGASSVSGRAGKGREDRHGGRKREPCQWTIGRRRKYAPGYAHQTPVDFADDSDSDLSSAFFSCEHLLGTPSRGSAPCRPVPLRDTHTPHRVAASLPLNLSFTELRLTDIDPQQPRRLDPHHRPRHDVLHLGQVAGDTGRARAARCAPTRSRRHGRGEGRGGGAAAAERGRQCEPGPEGVIFVVVWPRLTVTGGKQHAWGFALCFCFSCTVHTSRSVGRSVGRLPNHTSHSHPDPASASHNTHR